MKLKNKLILIFILFAGFVIFNNSNCFAINFFDINSSSQKDIVLNYINESLDSYYDSYFINYEIYSYAPKYRFYAFLYNSSDSFVVRTNHRNSAGDLDAYYYELFSDCSKNPKVKTFQMYFNSADSTSFSNGYPKLNEYNIRNSYNKRYYMIYWGDPSDYLLNSDIYFLTNRNIYLYNNSTGSQVSFYFDEIPFFSTLYEVQPETTKHDIFQLNLIDKNFNNSQHTFTLNTDENSVNYSEITDLIENNNKYCIYVTDYTRLLTLSDNSFNATLEGGSYLLSGYIDFLVSDNAYFYFSPHYNRIKVCSGDYRGHDMTTYTKRYFFNLVFSDDSDDAYFTISDDNGMLWALSDFVNDGTTSQSEAISDFTNTYFIGSNQTIYYAQEDSNYILDSLTDSIYYGKNRGEDTHVYNFAFSGGKTKSFYLSKATFDDDVSTQNNTIIEKSPVIVTEETQSLETPPVAPPVIYDNSNGQSSVIPQDTTTYTYPQDTVTDETSSQDDLTHVEPERVPYTSTDTNDDTSNWSIWDFVKGIFGKIVDVLSAIGNIVNNLISGLVSLFVPSSDFFGNVFTDLNDWFEIKLGFVFYPFQFFMNFFDRLLNIEFTEPIISIPDIREPFSDEILIHAVEFNFNSLLEDERINIAHNYYLMFVDVILIIGFINLLKNKFEEVTNK